MSQTTAATPPTESVRYHLDEHRIARLQFNRPDALNAINHDMAAAFLLHCQDMARTPGIRAIHLSGAGRAFMAGGDVRAMQAAPEPAAALMIRDMHKALRWLVQQDAPIVCTVQGAVAGAGLGVMLNADFVLAQDNTRFSVAYPLIGTSCDCSTSWLLPRMVGARKATELALLGEAIDAQEALGLGLINRVIPEDTLAQATEELLHRLAQGPTVAYGQLRRLLRSAWHNTLDNHLDAEAAGFMACAVTEDFREGLSAFLERRTPQFGGA